jgi:6-phosphogluconate dehydrogenase
VRDALYASKICSYAQGMNLIRRGSSIRLGPQLGEIARIWKGGCIIRAQFLDKIKQAYDAAPTCRTCCSTRTSSSPLAAGSRRPRRAWHCGAGDVSSLARTSTARRACR